MQFAKATMAALLAIGSAGTAAAAPFDGAKPFTCALVDAASCEPGSQCTRDSAAAINLPQFVTIDVQQRTIAGEVTDGEALSTKIDVVGQANDLLVLEGVQEDVSWTINIGRSSGRMSLAAVGDQVGFVVFGACIAPPASP